ncbi:MAG TPA: hypothetical protein VMN03_11055, partial [Burkholderiales bacterium]|nr:hypothetical protein [Burkholderiales bacterium]
MASQGGLMHRCRVRVTSFRVVPIRVFTGVEKKTDDFGVPVLRRPCEGPMSQFRGRGRKNSACIIKATG